MSNLNHKLDKDKITEYMNKRKGSITKDVQDFYNQSSKDITKPKHYRNFVTAISDSMESKQTHIGTHKTTVTTEGNQIAIRYHNTNVVKFSPNWIVLDSGGFRSATTKKRMNQTSQVYNLGYKVFQKNYNWFVDYQGKTIEYDNNQLILERS